MPEGRATRIGLLWMRARVEFGKTGIRPYLLVGAILFFVCMIIIGCFAPTITHMNQRAKNHAKRREFYRLYEVGVQTLDDLAHPHDRRPVVLYQLTARTDPAGFNAPTMVLHHPGVRHMRVDDQCAPGYESIEQLDGRDLLLGRLLVNFPVQASKSDNSEHAMLNAPNECVRSLGGDIRLLDKERDGCSQPFELSCGGWRNYIEHHVSGRSGELHRLNELSPDEYHLALTDVFEDALHDSESLIARVANAGIPIQATTQKTHGATMLELPLIPSDEIDFASCVMLALIRTDALTPVATMCDNVWPGCYDSYLDAMEQLEPDVLRHGVDCANVLITRGALGDGGIVQIDMYGERQQLVQLSESVLYLSRLLAPFGAYFVGFDADSTLLKSPGVLLRRVRLALPVGEDEPFGERHRMRLLRLAFGETVQDRFAHYIASDISTENLRALVSVVSSCVLGTDLKRAVHMWLPDPDVRLEAVDCIRGHLTTGTIGWTSIAPLSQRCWKARRERPGKPVFDLHVPAIGADDVALYFTPAMLQTPWYSNEMEPSETVARFYFPLVRAAVEAEASARRGAAQMTCEDVIHGNREAIQALTECFSTLLLERSFWVQLMQNFCDHPSAPLEVPLAVPHHTEGTHLWLRTPEGCMVDESSMLDMWTLSLQRAAFFRRAFNCPRKGIT